MTLFVSLLLLYVFSTAQAGTTPCRFEPLPGRLCPPPPTSPAQFTQPGCTYVDSGVGVCRATRQVEGMDGNYWIANCPSSFGHYNLFHYDCRVTTPTPTSLQSESSQQGSNDGDNTHFVIFTIVCLVSFFGLLFLYIVYLVCNAQKKKHLQAEQAGNKVEVVVGGVPPSLPNRCQTSSTAPPNYSQIDLEGNVGVDIAVISPQGDRPPSYENCQSNV